MKIEERIGRKIIHDPGTECILWSGCVDKDGYGKISFNNRTRRAHTVVFELLNTTIPKDKIIQHTCDVPGCVNPEHLNLGTWLSNMQDKVAKGRLRNQNMFKSMCKHGHEFVEGSFYVYQYKNMPGPKRVCKKCHSERQKRYKKERVNKVK